MDYQNTQPNHHLMFSSQEHEDFMDPNNPILISFKQQQDLAPDHHVHESVSIVDYKGKSVVHNPTSSTKKRSGNRASKGDDHEDDQIQKKIAHREIEKQRRLEMSKLYASLRELLPVELIKGNRSASDHMHQAVHYIKQMEENVKELGRKREQLKKFSNSTNENSTSNLRPNTVSISFSNGGVEILINSCSIEDGFMLSGVFNTLVEEGLNVISCTVTKVNGRLLHSIQTEECDLALIDPSMLHQRLSLIANAHQNSC